MTQDNARSIKVYLLAMKLDSNPEVRIHAEEMIENEFESLQATLKERGEELKMKNWQIERLTEALQAKDPADEKES